MSGASGPSVVSGGASGLGHALVRALSQAGSHVTVLDVKAGPPIDSTHYAVCDVTSEAQVIDALDQGQKRAGTARLIVNCAGIGCSAKVLGRDGVHPLDLFQRVLDVNLIGTFNVLRLGAQRLAQAPVGDDGQRGVIINVASIAAFDGQIGHAAYSAAKAAIVGMTLPLARELGRYAIRVVTICPGLFQTPMVEQHGAQAAVDKLLDHVAWPKRPGRSDEFAAFVLSVAANPMLNGEVIRLDAGLRMPAR